MLGIRGEDLAMVEPSAGFPLEVRVTEPMGSHTLLTGSVGGQQIRVAAPSDARPEQGTVLHLRPLPDRISWMDAGSGASLGAKA